jgi:hypothetical protein
MEGLRPLWLSIAHGNLPAQGSLITHHSQDTYTKLEWEALIQCISVRGGVHMPVGRKMVRELTHLVGEAETGTVLNRHAVIFVRITPLNRARRCIHDNVEYTHGKIASEPEVLRGGP